MNKEIYLTKEGLEKLKAEFKDLVENQRPKVIARIAQAREYGDLSENAEYADAREQQSFIEGRILELQNQIKNARIIEEGKENDQVALGRKVTLSFDGEKEEYILVGPSEGNPAEGKISISSPLGQALMGKKKGESVEVQTGDEKLTYKILNIS